MGKLQAEGAGMQTTPEVGLNLCATGHCRGHTSMNEQPGVDEAKGSDPKRLSSNKTDSKAQMIACWKIVRFQIYFYFYIIICLFIGDSLFL